METKNVWRTYNDDQLNELKTISDEYKRCLDLGKTERECVKLAKEKLENAGYQSLEEKRKSNEVLKTGDKV